MRIKTPHVYYERWHVTIISVICVYFSFTVTEYNFELSEIITQSYQLIVQQHWKKKTGEKTTAQLEIENKTSKDTTVTSNKMKNKKHGFHVAHFFPPIFTRFPI